MFIMYYLFMLAIPLILLVVVLGAIFYVSVVVFAYIVAALVVAVMAYGIYAGVSNFLEAAKEAA